MRMHNGAWLEGSEAVLVNSAGLLLQGAGSPYAHSVAALSVPRARAFREHIRSVNLSRLRSADMRLS